MGEVKDLEIRQATLVRADPQWVYEAFTTAEGLDAWGVPSIPGLGVRSDSAGEIGAQIK